MAVNRYAMDFGTGNEILSSILTSGITKFDKI